MLVFKCISITSRLPQGVHVYEKGRGQFDDCNIIKNALAGIVSSEVGEPSFSNSTIESNGGDGLVAYEKGRGALKECVIRKNGSSG